MFNIRKRDEQKNYAKNGRIGKCTFLIFEKGMSKKTAPGFLRFGGMLFLIFEKAMSKKIALGRFRFVSMLFLILEKIMSKEIAPGFISMSKSKIHK